MDSAQGTLIDIAHVSQRLSNILDQQIGRKTAESSRLDMIFVGSRAILEAFNKQFVLKDGTVDDRLVDWLKQDEHHACLQTLKQMEEILNRKVEYGVKNLFKASRSAQAQDKIGEAIRLFQMRKSYFHFLLMAGIWNRENDTQLPSLPSSSTSQPDVPRINQTESRNGSLSCDVQAKGNKGLNLEKLGSILGWLDAWNSRATHERTLLLRQPDTCTWLPNTSEFKKWRGRENPFLWLHGKPGAGKSVLAASVIQGLKDTLQDGEVLAHFYCDFREERSRGAGEVLRSLLSQLLRQSRCHATAPGDLIDELVEEKDGGSSTISNISLLARHVSRAVRQFREPPFLVIDALDECRDIEELLDALVTLQKGGVRLLAISRPLQIIKDSFVGLPSIDLETMGFHVSADIRLHVRRVLDSHRRLRILNTGLKDEIYSALCKKAGGMFRWVECQLNILKECETAKEIRKALENLPGDLDATYGRILLEIDRTKRQGDVARSALRWITVALQPLQLAQIMEGLSIDLKERVLKRDFVPVHGAALLDALGSLVVHDKETDVVTLSHFSVKEYLIANSTRTKYPGFHVDQQAVHTELAFLCLHYFGISFRQYQRADRCEAPPHGTYNLWTPHDNANTASPHLARYPGSSLQFFESHPLLDYVLSIGFYHLEYVNPRNRAILHAVEDFQLNARNYPWEWEQLCERGDHLEVPFPTLQHDLALYILIAFAPEPLLRAFINHTRLQPKDGTNPLVYAASFRKLEHARTLLSRGANPNHSGLSVRNPSRDLLPLSIAVWNRDRPTVDLFLDHGSHVPAELFVNVLDLNLMPRHIVSRLLQTDDFVEWAGVQDESVLLLRFNPTRYCHPFIKPSEKDIDTIQRRFLQIGCHSSTRDEAFLRFTASAGHVSTVKQMLSSAESFPFDIILDASRSGNSTMIRLFLDVGYEVNVASPIGDTPLHIVLQTSPRSENESLASVQVLVNAGCDPTTRNLTGKTVLHLAVSQRYISVVEYLHSLQVPLPPDILLEVSQATIMRSLISQGADSRVIAANGNTPLHLVLWDDVRLRTADEFLELAEILIDAGCDSSLANATGKTALDVAAGYGLLPVVQYLHSKGAPLSPTVLLHVVGGGGWVTPIIKPLINMGADVHVTRPNGDTLIHLAMITEPEPECLKRIKLLVNAGCDPHACNLAGSTPFHVAAEQRYIVVMEYLLALGVLIPPDIMLTQFNWKVSPAPPRFYSAARFLLGKGGDVRTLSKDGDTLLHHAAGLYRENDALEFVKLFVHAGCQPFLQNSRHETPLHTAAWQGYTSVIDYFLSLGVSLPADILLAASTGYSKRTQLIRYLVDKGVNTSAVTTRGDTPLHLLAINGHLDDHLESIKILIDAGCDPGARNSSSETLMHVAARHGSLSVLEYLLTQGIPLPDDILYTSAPPVLLSLFKKGVDVRCTATNIDMHLLHRTLDCYPHVFDEDSLECAKILVGAGWSPLQTNTAGETPIHAAARNGQLPVIQYLFSQCENAPPPSDVLLAAAPKVSLTDDVVEVFNFLIREGAGVNASTLNGDTTLHLILRFMTSIGYVYEEMQPRLWIIIEILLNCGADPSAENADEQKPIDIAKANGHFFNMNFLRLVRNAQACNWQSPSSRFTSS